LEQETFALSLDEQNGKLIGKALEKRALWYGGDTLVVSLQMHSPNDLPVHRHWYNSYRLHPESATVARLRCEGSRLGMNRIRYNLKSLLPYNVLLNVWALVWPRTQWKIRGVVKIHRLVPTTT
jgi:hypothetical protein